MKIPTHKETIWQMLFWALLWVLVPFLLTNAWEFPDRFLYRHVGIFIGILLLVGINLEILLPGLFWRGKTGLYALAGLALTTVIIILVHADWMPWSDWTSPQPRGRGHGRRAMIFNNMRWISLSVPFLTSFIGSALIAIARVANQRQKEAIILQREKLEAEMKFLKSQINPHFLFNALNNIYTLSVIGSEKTGENLLRLSDMLRYVIYDCSAKQVPLSKEVKYIQNYIDLLHLKESAGMQIKFQIEIENENLLIAPMIFVPFIENAFKHSKIEDLEKGWVKIKLEQTGKTIRFKVDNSVPASKFSKDRAGGVGLENVRRRLALIYPDNYNLDIRQEESIFLVDLKINMP